MKDAVLGFHFQFNILGSGAATSLFDVGRWAFDVGRSFSYKGLTVDIHPYWRKDL